MEQTEILVTELEACMDQMLAIYRPFADPGKDWTRGGDPLQDLVKRREEALVLGKPISDNFRQLWAAWELSCPPPEERARIFASRNRIVELGMTVSKSDTSIQTQLKHKSQELRRQAVESGNKAKAVRAYSR